MKHTITKAAIILLMTVNLISCSKDKEIIPNDELSISVPSGNGEHLPNFNPPGKNPIPLTLKQDKEQIFNADM